MQERKLPNQVLWSHRTGNGGKELLAHLGALLAAGNATSDRVAMDVAEMRLR